jgi:hypothetical protein
MAETKKYLVTAGPIGADRIYLNGEEIELDARAAARLLKEKKIRPVKPDNGKAGGAGEGQKDNSKEAGQKNDSKDAGSKDKIDSSHKKGGKK